MRQFTLHLLSALALTTLVAACGTKGPLTLPPPEQPAAKAPQVQPSKMPANDANTGTGQR